MAYDNLIEAYNIAKDVKTSFDAQYKDKSLDEVLRTSHFKRETLADSAFSLKSALDRLIVNLDKYGLTKKDESQDFVTKPDLKSIIESIIPTVIDKVKDTLLPEKNQANVPSSSDSVQVSPNIPNKSDHVIVVSGENGDRDGFNDTQWTDVVKKDLSYKLKSIPIKNTIKTHDGKACLFVEDESTVNDVRNALQSDYNVEVNRSTKRLPRVKMFDIDTSVYDKNSADKLKNDILEKNIGMKQLYDCNNPKYILDVVLINTDYNFAIIKLGEGLRSYVKDKGNRIYLDLTSHSVKDHFHLTQCYQCQVFGHKAGSSHCSGSQVCLYCAKSHRSSECPVKNDKKHHACSNCFSHTEFRANYRGHHANSMHCPYYIRQMEQMMRKTAGVFQNDFLQFQTKLLQRKPKR